MRALALLVLGLASTAAAQSRLGWARCELQGPMSEPTLELVAGSRTRLRGALLAGERVERVLPVVVDALGARGEPRWNWGADPDRAGRARFLGWVHEAEERWAALPPGLRARPRPPVSPANTRPPLALFFLLGGAALASVALARRGRWAAAGPSLAGCVLSWWIAGAGAPSTPQTWVVLEGQDGGGAWIEVRAAWESLDLPVAAAPSVLCSDPEAAPISIETSLALPGELALRARGAALYASRPCDPGPGRIGESGQDCADFESVWWRAEGEWSARGGWKRGQALPPVTSGAAAPGWLANGLPQGPRVCLARTRGPSPRWFRDLGP
jgi:hypothetical protein